MGTAEPVGVGVCDAVPVMLGVVELVGELEGVVLAVSVAVAVPLAVIEIVGVVLAEGEVVAEVVALADAVREPVLEAVDEVLLVALPLRLPEGVLNAVGERDAETDLLGSIDAVPLALRVLEGVPLVDSVTLPLAVLLGVNVALALAVADTLALALADELAELLLLLVRVTGAETERVGDKSGETLVEPVPLAVPVREAVTVGVGVSKNTLDVAPPGLMSNSNSPDTPTPPGSST